MLGAILEGRISIHIYGLYNFLLLLWIVILYGYPALAAELWPQSDISWLHAM